VPRKISLAFVSLAFHKDARTHTRAQNDPYSGALVLVFVFAGRTPRSFRARVRERRERET